MALQPGTVRPATAGDRLDVARLIHASTNGWYESQGASPVFGCAPDDCAIYFDVYEHLDPGHCLTVRDESSGALLGSCFVHPRRSHWSLGIMNVAPAAFGHGVASRLLDHICAGVGAAGLPLRLVSSARNLDSFSLYNSRGFAPVQVFQDVLFEVPQDGLDVPANVRPQISGLVIRRGRAEEASDLAALERTIHGLDRAGDLEFFAADPLGCFRLFVAEDGEGTPQGWLASVRHPATAMLGPGVAHDEATAFALLCHALDAHHRGGRCVGLVPSDRPRLVHAVRGLGGRNVELHLAQVRPGSGSEASGSAPAPPGVAFPTFLPESA